MKKLALTASVLTLAAGTAYAGGIERAGDPTRILFEEGKNYVEFSFASVSPNISGEPIEGAPGGNTGDIAQGFVSLGLSYKYQLNDKVALAFVIDEPVGAEIEYDDPTGPTLPDLLASPFFAGSDAEVDSIAYTALGKYKFNDRFSIYGGVRLQGLSGEVNVIAPLAGVNFNLDVDTDYRFGYLAGVAYEIPEIALRLGLTYQSRITHTFEDNNGDDFDVEIPQAVTFNAQTGIAKDTLLFGSVRWVDWNQFVIAPNDFTSLPQFGGAPIASEPSDIVTYTLGVGRRFTENWSAAVSLGYEEDQGDVVGNLSGRDGFLSYGLAVTYENEHMKLTTGIRYADVGGADTSVASFRDNDFLAVGFRLGFKF